jgi:uncharacterized protein (TIGR03437 family)
VRRISLTLFVLAGWAHAQGVITTIAGTDFLFPRRPQPAVDAPLGRPSGVAADAQGNLYIADQRHSLILKLDRQGTLTIVAGNGTRGFSGEGGPATSASLNAPNLVALDAAGNLYIADGGNLRIRKVAPNGIITTVAGNGTLGYSGDGGLATRASLSYVSGLAADGAGNLYISGSFSIPPNPPDIHVRRISTAGIITRVAGNGIGFAGDGGPALNAAFRSIAGLTVDAAGNLYVSDVSNHRIRRIAPNGIISTFAGTGVTGYSGDGGPAAAAALSFPTAVTADAAGNVFFADGQSSTVPDRSRIRKVSPSGVITTVAGNGSYGFVGDGGPAIFAAFSSVPSIAADSLGNLFIADLENSRVRKVGPDQIVNTVAGSGRDFFGGDGGPAISAFLNIPRGLAEDGEGGLYIADGENHRIRRISRTGIITTVAGTGNPGYSGDGGVAIRAALTRPGGLALDADGNLYIADSGNRRVRKLTREGIISTVAGNGTSGFTGDGGPALNAGMVSPIDLALDRQNNLYIADSGGRVRKVTPGGIISTVAGGGNPSLGNFGDGGPAVGAFLPSPGSVALDFTGNLLIAQGAVNISGTQYGGRIRRVTPGGVITTVAGDGPIAFSGDGGPATRAGLGTLLDMVFDPAGNLFIVDGSNRRVRRISADGIITTVAGNGELGFAGDGGLATSAVVNALGLLVPAGGGLLIGDNSNRIRKVLPAPPRSAATPSQLRLEASSNGAIPPVQTVTFSSEAPGLAFSARAGASWLRVSPAAGAAPRLIEVTADPTNLAPGTYTSAVVVEAPNGAPASLSINVTFLVTALQPPILAIDKPSLSFPYPRDGRARSQTVTISNTGGGTLSFTAAAQTTAGGNWLAVSPGSGQATPSNAATLAVTADPAGLPPGTYNGSLVITAGAHTRTLPVTMTVSQANQAILLSQTGLSFIGVSRGGVLPPQTFGVLNIGTGVVTWQASKSTLTGGPDWLQIGSASGATDAAGAASTVAVSVNPSNLPEGKYYGQVRVDAPQAANSPQVLTVFLQVLPEGSDIGAMLQPSELLFAASAAAGSPGSQELQIYNVAAEPKSFRAVIEADAGLNVITVPTDGTLDPQNPTRLIVQPFTDGLAPGLYRAAVSLQFSDGRVGAAKLSVAVRADSTAPGDARGAEAACQPKELLAALTTLGQTFVVPAGWPVGLAAEVKDDCGAPLDSGSVSISFSNGDATLSLQPLRNGRWEATWPTRSASSDDVILKLRASDPQRGLRGEREIRGKLQTQTDPPVFERQGVFSAAGGAPFQPIAPGSIVSIYGSRLARAPAQFGAAPLPTALLDTEVVMGGRSVPLYYVSDNQINAQVPFDLTPNTTHQILVVKGPTYSQPIPVDVAPAQPAIFRDFSVSPDQGIVLVIRGDSFFEAKPGTPARAGDVIVVYAAGLGPVDPAVASGAVPGPALSNTASPVELRIGGAAAPVAFAGLSPGFVGLYQINATVPEGVPSGDRVQVTIAVAGQSSAPVTMAVE